MDDPQENKPKNRTLAFAAIVLTLAGALGIALKFLTPRAAPPPPAPVAQTAPAPAVPPAPVLPKLEQSDDFLRVSAAGLASDSKWADWLKSENLIRRFVAATAIVADGNSPRDSLAFLKPETRFSTARKGGKILIDAKSYARYDAVASVVDSINAAAAAKLLRLIMPLLQQAYAELGDPSRDFQTTLAQAIAVLLKTPADRQTIALRAKVISYAMVDPELEKLRPAQKHLLRMGPKNIAKIQGKLALLARELGLSPAK